MIESNEVFLFESGGDKNWSRRYHRAHLFDFLPVSNDPSASLKASRFEYWDSDPDGTDTTQLPRTAEQLVVAGNFFETPHDELIRAMEDEKGEILFYAQKEVKPSAETQFIEDADLLFKIPAADPYLAVDDGLPHLMLKAANFGTSDYDHLIVAYLRKTSDGTYRLHLALWQNGIQDSMSFEIKYQSNFPGPSFDLEVIDFELDGVPEIAIVYGSTYFTDDNESRPVKAMRILEFKDRQISVAITKDQPETKSAGYIYDICGGDLNGDGVDELIVSSTWLDYTRYPLPDKGCYSYSLIEIFEAVDDSQKRRSQCLGYLNSGAK